MIDEPAPAPQERRRRLSRIAGIVGLVGMSALCAVAAGGAILGRPHQETRLAGLLSKALPGAAVTGVDCRTSAAPQGFCEFIVGGNVFYATPDGRYVVVGQILDLTRRIDLTERRRIEVRGLASATDLISGARTAAGGPAPGTAGPPPPPSPPPSLKIDLPAGNAVVHNRGAPLKVAAFTDFNCHYCRQLFESLAGVKDVELTEYPIAILGEDSERKASAVLCASDRAIAAGDAYRGKSSAGERPCAEGGRQVQENRAFAQAHGVNGTPMIVRSDGATNAGWMPKDQLLAWLRQASGPSARTGR